MWEPQLRASRHLNIHPRELSLYREIYEYASQVAKHSRIRTRVVCNNVGPCGLAGRSSYLAGQKGEAEGRPSRSYYNPSRSGPQGPAWAASSRTIGINKLSTPKGHLRTPSSTFKKEGCASPPDRNINRQRYHHLGGRV